MKENLSVIHPIKFREKEGICQVEASQKIAILTRRDRLFLLIRSQRGKQTSGQKSFNLELLTFLALSVQIKLVIKKTKSFN